ncbi:MAG: DUF2971 domain-containing protein, partial [Candidatus Lokiarchaeota archaeon]|nr:DUF2971 domain-containing protein [Candidatus Lokiarchaeota archaeon]
DYGFSIGFEYSKIIRLLKTNKLGDFLLLPCYYKDENKKDYIDSIIQSVFNSILTSSAKQSDKNTSLSKIFTNAFKEYTEKVIKIGSIFKSDSFSEESEWRLVYYKRKETASLDIKFRNGNAMIIPYIEFPLENKYKTTPITKIIVGPSPNQDISIESVSRFLSSSNIRCEVEKSNIPFRKL